MGIHPGWKHPSPEALKYADKVIAATVRSPYHSAAVAWQEGYDAAIKRMAAINPLCHVPGCVWVQDHHNPKHMDAAGNLFVRPVGPGTLVHFACGLPEGECTCG